MKSILLTILAFMMISPVAFGQTKSIYTSLLAKDCIASPEPVEGGYSGVCPGTTAYALEFLEGDLRQTINVIAPNKKKFELNLWTNVSSGFSSLGTKAEWRMKGKTPAALIIRYNASENPEDSSKITSYLVVAKITASQVCIVDILKPSKTQNIDARKVADAASNSTCKF